MQFQAGLRARFCLHTSTRHTFAKCHESEEERVLPGRLQLAVRAQFDIVEQTVELTDQD